MFRAIHSNGASFFFFCIYIHLLRNLYYNSFTIIYTWMIGVTLLIIRIATAFLGYVLPWGQISLWGATVITNLLSSIPYIGSTLVYWLWGGRSVEAPTLTRFFCLHFTLPFIIFSIIIIHVIYLHQTGSNNPLGLNRNNFKIPLNPYFLKKDILSAIFLLWTLIIVSIFYPNTLGDPENFNFANSLISPAHIKPEWYYLFAYTILRSIPNKLGGVIALVSSIFIFYLIPFLFIRPLQFIYNSSLLNLFFWIFLIRIIVLTWIGAKRVEDPYTQIGQIFTTIYFCFFFIPPFFFNKKKK